MALADVSEIINAANSRLNREQQQKQFEQELGFREQQMKAEQAHQQAVLDAAHAYQNAELQRQYLQGPSSAIRAAGQPTGTNFGSSATGSPGMIGVGPVSQNYQIDTGLGKPLNFVVPTPEQEGIEEEARTRPTYQRLLKGETTLENLKQQGASDIEKQRQEAQEYRDNVNYLKEKMKDAEAYKRALDLADVNGKYRLKAAEAAREANPNLRVDEQAGQQIFNDAQNGVMTQEEFNKAAQYNKATKQAASDIMSSGNVKFLTNDQKKALTGYSQLLPALDEIKQLINAYPETDSSLSAAARDKLADLTDSKVKSLKALIEGKFGTYAKNYSDISTGRISNIEANKALGAVLPGHVSTQEKINQLNKFIQDVHHHLDISLQGIPEAQKRGLIDQYSKGFDTTPLHSIHDLRNQLGIKEQTQPTQIPAGKLHVIRKSDGQEGYIDPKDFNDAKYKKVQ